MKSQCETVHQVLVEGTAGAGQRDPVVDSHLESCEACQEFAASEERLVEYLIAASPPGDVDLQKRVILAIQVLEARRRRLALLPVAASAILGLVGITVLGGVPGASLVAALPSWAGSGWVALMGTVLDTIGALDAVAAGLADVVSAPVVLGAVMVFITGIGTTVLISKRLRRRAIWSARS